MAVFAPNRIHFAVRLVVVVLLWASYTLSQTPGLGWKARVNTVLEKLGGWKGIGSGITRTSADNDDDDSFRAAMPDNDNDDDDDSFRAAMPDGNHNHNDSFQATMPFEDDGAVASPVSGTTTRRYHRRQIPCGLIVVAIANGASSSPVDEDVTVLPLATLAVAGVVVRDRNGNGNENSTTEHEPEAIPNALSTLHARALERYPLLERYVVSSSDETGYRRVIPKGTFRLRMGSEDSTIEESPPLWIVEETQNINHRDRSNDDYDYGDGAYQHQHDLVLGGVFWEEHSAEFGSDEVYLRSSPSSEAGDAAAAEGTKRAVVRVMVPYLSMRSKPDLFGTDL